MKTGNKWTKVLGILSLVGGITVVPLMIAFARTGWGTPGTAAYETYELLNRLTAFSLLLMAAGWGWRSGVRVDMGDGAHG